MLPYDSDHYAMNFKSTFDNDYILFNNSPHNSKKDIFKATNWNKFMDKLDKQFNIHVLCDRNLTNAEINNYILIINKNDNKHHRDNGFYS